MVSFNTLVVCLSVLVSACSARGGHGHLHRRGLQARAAYNGTETTLLPNGTGNSVIPPPAELTTTTTADYTTTVTQTSTKLVTITYTLGNGAVKTATVTKSEETVQTIAHVKSTVTVAPIIETTAPASAPVVSAVSSGKPKSTSTTTQIVTIDGPGTATVSIAAEVATSTAVAACSVQTVYIPQYVTLYNTVTISAAAAPTTAYTATIPLYSNNTVTESTISYESTSTTTLSVYTTVYVRPSAI